MNKRFVYVYLCIVCVWATIISGCPSTKPSNEDVVRARKLPSSSLSNAIDLQRKGVIKTVDYAKLTKVGSLIGTGRPIPDGDLDFALSALKSGPITDAGDNRLQYYRVVLANLTGKKNLTAAQANKLIDAVIPLATSSDKDVQLFAIPVLSSTRDARVIPILEKIGSDTKDERVRKVATSQIPRLKELTGSPK